MFMLIAGILVAIAFGAMAGTAYEGLRHKPDCHECETWRQRSR